MMRSAAIVALLIASAAAKDRIAYIEFFGYKDIDVEAVRRALPFHEGDARPKSLREQAIAAVRRVIGHEPTDVAQICCVGDGDGAIFIGLPGGSSGVSALDAAPMGDAPLSPELLRLGEAMLRAEMAAISAGRPEQDGRPGYRLLKEPRARATELAVRAYALRHEDEIVRTLQQDRRESHRALAADALGYGARTPRQIAALVGATRDPKDAVRNNATRALGEIAAGDSSAVSLIPPDRFVEMVRSGVWTDRNKASLVLLSLTESHSAGLLQRLKAEAEDALEEMARWRPTGWSFAARMILGRAAGVPDALLIPLVNQPADEFFAGIKH